MISEVIPYQKRFLEVSGHAMACVDAGQGNPIVFLHGNPTSSYLWRNIIPHLQPADRSIAPDLIGMGDSQKLTGSGPGSYTFAEHRRYLDGLLASLGVERNVTLVVHDWGSALGFDWANRHRDAVRGIAYMEAITQPVTWDQWSAQTRTFFEKLRSPDGEQMVLDDNLFVESLLPQRVLRTLTGAEMDAYRRPFREPGEDRRPTLTWPRQLPIDGEPADVCQIVTSYGRWLAASPAPKLFINADPGTISADERLLPQLAQPGRSDRTRPALPPGGLARPDRAGTRQLVYVPPPLIIALDGRDRAAGRRRHDTRNRSGCVRTRDPRRSHAIMLGTAAATSAHAA